MLANLKGWYLLGDLVADWRITLKLIFKKLGMMMWTVHWQALENTVMNLRVP
jgi:hypothetical protein